MDSIPIAVLAYLLGFVTGIVLRIGRERRSFLLGVAIGRRKRVKTEEWQVR